MFETNEYKRDNTIALFYVTNRNKNENGKHSGSFAA